MPALIGTRAVAENVLNHPEEFKLVGSGGTRYAYLHDGVVYKTERKTSWSEGYDNACEYSVASRLLRKVLPNDQWYSPFVRIPLVSMFRITGHLVLAMQYIEAGPNKHSSIEAHRSLYSLGFRDMHNYNYIVDKEDIIWPVDMGTHRTRTALHFDAADVRALHPSDPNHPWYS